MAVRNASSHSSSTAICPESRLSMPFILEFSNPVTRNPSHLPSVTRSASIGVAQASSIVPPRFCAQAKDKFVIRVVKVTEKNSSLKDASNLTRDTTTSKSLRNTLQNPDEMHQLQTLLIQSATNSAASVFVGFQAQLPALAWEYAPRSTSADQVHILDEMQMRCQRRLGKGVRLCFSCPLRGGGLKLDDFKYGNVAQNLQAWEQRSGRPGILQEVLQALKQTVDVLLFQIKQDGLRTIKPDSDYIFYIHAPAPFVPSVSRNQLPSFQKVPKPLNLPRTLFPSSSTYPTGPVSASGTGFDTNTSMEQSMLIAGPLYSAPAASDQGSNVDLLSDYLQEQSINQHCQSAKKSSISNSHCVPNEVGPYNFSSSGSFPGGIWANSLPHLPTSRYPAASAVMTSSMPVPQTNTANNGHETEAFPENSPPLSNQEDPMSNLINEVVNRLRRNPHLPLIVMPTQAPDTLPLVFQIPSPNDVFVGLPATKSRGGGSDRPRVVTSPAESSCFIVTAKKVPGAATRDMPPLNHLPGVTDTVGFTVAAPRPGYVLGITSDGDIFEYEQTQ